MNTPIGTIYTTTAIKAFTELTGMTPEQYILGINNNEVGDGAKITLANLAESLISAQANNLITIGSDLLLNIDPSDISQNIISSVTGILNLLELGGDGKLLVEPENVSENSISSDADNALLLGTDNLLYVPVSDTEGADIDLSNLSATGNSKLINSNVIDLGTVSTGTTTLMADRMHKVTFSGAATIALPTGLTSGVHYNCSVLVTMSSVVTITQPTVTWAYGISPTLTSTSVKYRITYETIDGGTTWYGYWTQLGA